jgi:hypothetical protein
LNRNLAGLAQLVEAVPDELLVLDPTDYAALVADVAYLRALGEAFQARAVIYLNLTGHDRNPVALIREAMARCPDQAPTQETTTLTFISVRNYVKASESI